MAPFRRVKWSDPQVCLEYGHPSPNSQRPCLMVGLTCGHVVIKHRSARVERVRCDRCVEGMV